MAKAKGTAILGLVRFLRRHRNESVAALPERLRHYLDERVHVSAWYPEEDLLALARAVAPMLPPAAGDPYEAMGRVSARDHLEGSYAHLFQGMDDPLAIPARAFALWASMHDSGRLDTAVEPPDAVRVELSDFALPSREMCRIVGGYLAETLRIVGFAAPQAVELGCRLDGAPSCAWRCSFSTDEGLATRKG
jgi:hypothetical protein